MNDKLLTEKETADYLGIHKNTLANWRSRGRKGPDFIRVSGSIRYRESAIAAWLERRTVNMG